MNNDKLNELAIKAGLISEEDGKFTRTYLNYEEKRFAELILQECFQACMNEGASYEEKAAGAYQSNLYVTAIKRHFGVEERKGWVCSKCGVDRIRDVCPKGDTAALTGECPMTGKASLRS
jgi:hypothetical protein